MANSFKGSFVVELGLFLGFFENFIKIISFTSSVLFSKQLKS